MADSRTIIEVSGTRRIVREYDATGKLSRVRIQSLSEGPTADLPPVQPTPPPAAAPQPRAAPATARGSRFRKTPENSMLQALEDEAAPPPAPTLPVILEAYAEPVAAPAGLSTLAPAEPEAPQQDRALPIALEPYAEEEPPAPTEAERVEAPPEAPLVETPLEPEPEPEPEPTPPVEAPILPPFQILRVDRVPPLEDRAEAHITLPPLPEPAEANEPVRDVEDVAEAPVAVRVPVEEPTPVHAEPAPLTVTPAAADTEPEPQPKKTILARFRRKAKPEAAAEAPAPQEEAEPQPNERSILARFRRKAKEEPARADQAEARVEVTPLVEKAPPAEPERMPEPEPAVHAPEPMPEPEQTRNVPILERAPEPVRFVERVPDVEVRVDAVLAAREAQRREAKKHKPLPVPRFEPLKREAWESRLDEALNAQ